MRVLVILLALVIGFGAGYVTGGRAPAATKTKQPQPSRPQAAGKEPVVSPASGYSLRPARHDFGKLLEGERRTAVLYLQRPPNTAIRLGRIFSPCPCIFVRTDKLNFAAREKVTVTVQVHTSSLQGLKSFPVYLQVVSPVRQIVRADISVNVTRVPARMLVKPASLHLGAIRKTRTASVTLYNLTARPVTLKTVTSTLPGVKPEVAGDMRIPAGESRVIKVTTKGLSKGMVKGELIIETDCGEHLKMSVPVDGTVLP